MIGQFEATVAIHFADAALVRSWLGPDVELQRFAAAPEGKHPFYVAFIQAEPAQWSLLPFWKVKIAAMTLVVPHVRLTQSPRGYVGPYAHVLRWWCDDNRSVRLGGRLWGVPPDRQRIVRPKEAVQSSAEVPGCLRMDVRDHGEIPEWPKVRTLCHLLQQPMLARRPNGQFSVAGLYWQLGDADMRACETKLELLPAALPQTAPLPGGSLTCQMDGTRDMTLGGTFRLGSVWTMTRPGTPERDWTGWRAGSRLRLRVDLSPHDIGPLAERMKAEEADDGS